MKILKNKYYLMMIIGVVLTLLLFNKLCGEIPTWLTISLDVLAMLGSGIFCSAIVSLIIDKQNQKVSVEKIEEQRNFILSSSQRNIVNLYKRELTELSIYHTNYILKEKGKWIKQELTLSEIGEEIVSLLNKIKEFENKQVITADMTVIDSDYIKREEKKYPHLAKNTRLYYENLYQDIQRIISQADSYFINDIFDKKQIDDFKMFAWEVQDNLSFSSEQEVFDGTLLETKLTFFEKTDEIISLLKISDKKEYLHYRGI